MKKHMMHKRYSTHAETGPDIAGLINKMQEQLVSLERKIDTLIGRSSQKPAEVKPFHSRGLVRQDNNYRERTLHKAICADCNKECEVPFKPSGGRPVYCKVCFSKRKAGSPEGRPAASYRGEGSPEGRPAASYRGGGSPPKERSYNRPREAPRLRSGQASPPQAVHTDRPHGGEKKRLTAKRRKARA